MSAHVIGEKHQHSRSPQKMILVTFHLSGKLYSSKIGLPSSEYLLGTNLHVLLGCLKVERSSLLYFRRCISTSLIRNSMHSQRGVSNFNVGVWNKCQPDSRRWNNGKRGVKRLYKLKPARDLPNCNLPLGGSTVYSMSPLISVVNRSFQLNATLLCPYRGVQQVSGGSDTCVRVAT